MESLKHKDAYISPPVCTNRLIFGKGAFFILFFLNMLFNPNPILKDWTFFKSIKSHIHVVDRYFYLISHANCEKAPSRSD